MRLLKKWQARHRGGHLSSLLTDLRNCVENKLSSIKDLRQTDLFTILADPNLDIQSWLAMVMTHTHAENQVRVSWFSCSSGNRQMKMTSCSTFRTNVVSN